MVGVNIHSENNLHLPPEAHFEIYVGHSECPISAISPHLQELATEWEVLRCIGQIEEDGRGNYPGD